MKTRRIVMAFVGVILTGLCIGIFQTANLGTDPFTSFVTGIAKVFGSGYSTFYVIVTGLLFAAVWFLERHYIGIATIINLFFTGISADIMRNFLAEIIPNPGMGMRVLLLVIGVIGMSFSASLYFVADLGVSAYDAWALMASDKYKLAAFRVCRITTDSFCCIVGFLCGVKIGIATIITALCMGPIIQIFNVHVSIPLLQGKK